MKWLKNKLNRFLLRVGIINDLFQGRLAIQKAQLSAVVIKADGTRKDLGVICKKKVTNAFVADIVAAMADSAGSSELATFNDYKYHDSGTGTTAEANTQTALVTPWGGSRDTGTQVDGGSLGARTYASVATTTYNSTFAITEHAVFNASSTGTMLDRSVFSAINVENGDSIQFTYTLTINSEA